MYFTETEDTADTKPAQALTGASSVDTERVEIEIYHDTIKEAEDLGVLVRAALDMYTGTLNGNTAQRIRFRRQRPDMNIEEEPMFYQEYQLRIEQ